MGMYKNILIPTDGTDLSRKAIYHGIELARSMDAKVTGLNISLPWTTIAIGEIVSAIPEADYIEAHKSFGEEALQIISDTANAAGVTCNVVHVFHNHPYQAILETARDEKCDLICMASHGRRGLEGLILGSETVKVLTHCNVPVLVYK